MNLFSLVQHVLPCSTLDGRSWKWFVHFKVLRYSGEMEQGKERQGSQLLNLSELSEPHRGIDSKAPPRLVLWGGVEIHTYDAVMAQVLLSARNPARSLRSRALPLRYPGE